MDGESIETIIEEGEKGGNGGNEAYYEDRLLRENGGTSQKLDA